MVFATCSQHHLLRSWYTPSPEELGITIHHRHHGHPALCADDVTRTVLLLDSRVIGDFVWGYGTRMSAATMKHHDSVAPQFNRHHVAYYLPSKITVGAML